MFLIIIKTRELTSRKTQQHIKVQRARVQRFLWSYIIPRRSKKIGGQILLDQKCHQILVYILKLDESFLLWK